MAEKNEDLNFISKAIVFVLKIFSLNGVNTWFEQLYHPSSLNRIFGLKIYGWKGLILYLLYLPKVFSPDIPQNEQILVLTMGYTGIVAISHLFNLVFSTLFKSLSWTAQVSSGKNKKKIDTNPAILFGNFITNVCLVIFLFFAE